MKQPDFRPSLTHAQHWVTELLRHVQPDQLDDPTPCSEFTVAQLIEHLLAVQERIERMGATGGLGDNAPFTIALGEESPADDFGRRARGASAAWQAWSGEDLWTLSVTAPFGHVPGGVALMMYAGENLVHGWDLAVATGQPSETDPEIVAPILAGMKQGLPAEPRDDVPFGPVVTPRADAGLTEQLANWEGHAR